MNKDEILAKLPKLPGIYIFKDVRGTILYVGKAKNVRMRVSSYFRRAIGDWKVSSLMQEATTVECVIAHNEHDALVLEAKLVQEHKPKYNTLLKEGNPFLYLQITPDYEVCLVRQKEGKGTFFGPFVHKTAARSCYRYLMRTFRLHQCAGIVTGGCLQAHIGICAGNCLPNWSMTDYHNRVRLLEAVLQGDFELFERQAREQIQRYSGSFEFEKAKHIAAYLDDWHHIRSVLEKAFSERRYSEAVREAVAPLPTAIHYAAGVRELQKLMGIAHDIHTIDCFDISHMQGREMVGSCVRFTEGVPDKNALRRFRIKTVQGQNDYAALQEIVRRRYAHDTNDLPDVILIDGGKGQLGAVRVVLPDGPLVSLAKREERLFTREHPEGVVLDVATPLGTLMIRLRDYAHQTAIRYHRLLRRKGVS